VKLAVPLPVPVPPDVKVMKAALLVAVHAQFVPAVTVIVAEPVPPSGPNVVVGWTTLKAHVGAVVVVLFLLQPAATSAKASAAFTTYEKRPAIMRAPW
jgi:hypothetical protein